MIDAVAALGDVSDINCWSGIPWHFMRAAQGLGEAAKPWPLRITRQVAWRRWRWNLVQLLKGVGIGGYQYSQTLLGRAEAAIPDELWRGHIVSFNQHFPRALSVANRGGRVTYYVDATFASHCTPGGLAERLPRHVREQACALERENYASSERVVTMARWAAESVIRDCGVPSTKVFTILPGANMELPEGFEFPAPVGEPGRERPLVLGFVGKDWERKGLPFLLDVRLALKRMSVPAVIRCAGNCPRKLRRTPGLEYAGFIDKAWDPRRFVAFMTSCDIGCLFSRREPLGISTLEFLRAGVPVAGFSVEGVADTLPPDAGWRFTPGTSAETVASAICDAVRDPSKFLAMRNAAATWSPQVTWERCVAELLELVRTGLATVPVRPWLGLAGLLGKAQQGRAGDVGGLCPR